MKINENQGDLYPSAFHPLHRLEPAVQAVIAPLYDSPFKPDKLMAALINHCFSARTSFIMVTRGSLQSCVDDDPNITNKFVVSSREHIGFARLCKEGGLMHIVVNAVKGQRGKAGLNTLNAELIQLLDLKPEEEELVNRRLETVKGYKELVNKLTEGT